LIIATGTREGTYYQIAQDLKRIAEQEGIPLEIISTNGSFDNINLLGNGKADLAILQLDVLKFVADAMQIKAGFDVFEETKVVLNLYPEEIHVITNVKNVGSLYHLDGKRVAVGPENSGSALTAEVLLAVFDLRVEKHFLAPAEALAKIKKRELDALIFVGGSPVPAFEKLDDSFHFVRVPFNAILQQVYQRKTVEASVYPWAGEFDTFAVPSVIMTRNRKDPEYVASIQKLLLAILDNKAWLDSNGHPKWKSSNLLEIPINVGYPPSNEIIKIFKVLDANGYRVIKK